MCYLISGDRDNRWPTRHLEIRTSDRTTARPAPVKYATRIPSTQATVTARLTQDTLESQCLQHRTTYRHGMCDAGQLTVTVCAMQVDLHSRMFEIRFHIPSCSSLHLSIIAFKSRKFVSCCSLLRGSHKFHT